MTKATQTTASLAAASTLTLAFDYAQVLSDAGAQAYLCDAEVQALEGAISRDSWTAVIQAVARGGMSPRMACNVLLDGYVQAANVHGPDVLTVAPRRIRKRYNSYCSILIAALAQGIVLVDADGDFTAKGTISAQVVKKPAAPRAPKITAHADASTTTTTTTAPTPATPAMLTIDAGVIDAVMGFLLGDSPDALFARQANMLNFERLSYQLSRDAEIIALADKAKNKSLKIAMKILEKQQAQVSA